MEKLQSSLSNLLQDESFKTRCRKENETLSSVHLYKINNVREKSSRNCEETTTWTISDKYICVGRPQFYVDHTQVIYLEISNIPSDTQLHGLVKASWKVEIIDENDCSKTFLLGESSFFVREQSERFVAHSKDWISVNLGQLEDSKMIAVDESLTIRWAVTILDYTNQKKSSTLAESKREGAYDIANIEKRIDSYKSHSPLESLKHFLTAINETESPTLNKTIRVFHVCPDLKEIMSAKEYSSSTPIHIATDMSNYSLRGTVEKMETGTLYLYLKYCSSDIQTHLAFKWSADVYHSINEEYLQICDSLFNIQDIRESISEKIGVHTDTLHNFLQNNQLIIAWSVELVSPCENKPSTSVKCLDGVESVNISDDRELESRIDSLFSSLSKKISNRNQKRKKVLLQAIAEKKINKFEKQMSDSIKDIQLIKNDVFEVKEILKNILSEDANIHSETSHQHESEDMETDKTNSLQDEIRSDATSKYKKKGPNIDLLVIERSDCENSAFRNYLRQCSTFIGEPQPTSIAAAICESTEFNGRNIKVVYISCLDYTDWGGNQNEKCVVDMIPDEFSIKRTGYHAVILVYELSRNVNTEEKTIVDYLKNNFGENFVKKHCIIVIAYKDHFKQNMKTSFQEWVNSQTSILAELMQECNYRVILFDKKTREEKTKSNHLDDLIETIDDLIFENSSFKFKKESIILMSRKSEIHEEIMREADAILQTFQRSKMKVLYDTDITTLHELLTRADVLFEEVEQKDNNTGVLRDTLAHVQSIGHSIRDEIRLCRQMSEYKNKLQRDYAEQNVKITKELPHVLRNIFEQYIKQNQAKTLDQIEYETDCDKQLEMERFKEKIQLELSSILLNENMFLPKVNEKKEFEIQCSLSDDEINHDMPSSTNILKSINESPLEVNKYLTRLPPRSLSTLESKRLSPPLTISLPAEGFHENHSCQTDIKGKLTNSKSMNKKSGPDLDLLMIGKTGSGKSALGNSLLEQNAFKSNPSCAPVTKEVCYGVSEFYGRKITVVDTPGVADADWSDDVTENYFCNAMADAININPRGYHAFLLVFKFGCRVTRKDKEIICYLKRIFGNDFLKRYCICVMTCGDFFEQEVEHECFNEWIDRQRFSDLAEIVTECQKRVILFDNKTKDKTKKQKQLNDLIQIVDLMIHDSSRYNNEQFEQSEHLLFFKADKLLITDETMTECNNIIQIFKKAQEAIINDNDTTLLEELLNKANVLYEGLVTRDEKSGILSELIAHVRFIQSSINDEIKLCHRIEEYKENLRHENEKLLTEEMRRMRDTFDNILAGNRKLCESEASSLTTDIEDFRSEFEKVYEATNKLEKDNKRLKTKKIDKLYLSSKR